MTEMISSFMELYIEKILQQAIRTNINKWNRLRKRDRKLEISYSALVLLRTYSDKEVKREKTQRDTV